MLLDQPDVLASPRYRSATGGQRFVNFVIDSIMVWLVTLSLAFIVGIIIVMVGSDVSVLTSDSPLKSRAINFFFGSVATILYYTFFELTTGGKTVGKYATRTRALTKYDEKMDLPTTMIRSLCRLVPFDTLSFLGDDASGWHDKWSETKVVDEKRPLE